MVSQEISEAERIMGVDINYDFIVRDIKFNTSNDFEVNIGYDNLKAAVANRLITRKGNLKSHPDYGSNLHLVYGKPGDNDTLGEAALYIQEAIDDEPRVDTLDDLELEWIKIDGNWHLVIRLRITPIGSNVEQNLVINYNI